MKILLISYSRSSFFGFRFELLKLLAEQYHEVYVVSSIFSPEEKNLLGSIGVTPLGLQLSRSCFNPIKNISELIRLLFMIRKIKPELTITYFFKANIFGNIASFFASVKNRFIFLEGAGYPFTKTSNIAPPFFSKKSAIRYVSIVVYFISCRLSTRTYFLNSDDQSLFRSLNIIPHRKSFFYGPIGVPLNQWKYKHRVVKSYISFIFIGRLLREKGLYEYLIAAETVKKIFPHAVFNVIGNFDKANPSSISREFIDYYIDRGVITYHGVVPAIDYLYSAHVLVLPSYREGASVSVQEAMASGIPVITSNAPGCYQLVKHGISGFICDTYNPDSLALQMLRFCINPELVSSMGHSARKDAEKRFNRHKINEKFAEDIAGI